MFITFWARSINVTGPDAVIPWQYDTSKAYTVKTCYNDSSGERKKDRIIERIAIPDNTILVVLNKKAQNLKLTIINPL